MRYASIPLAALALVLSGCAPSAPPQTPVETATPSASPDDDFRSLEEEYDAHLGIYAIDTGTGETVEFNADERFAYASTFKALAAAAVLQETTDEQLEQTVTYTADELVEYSPVTELHVDTGLPLSEIAAAAVQLSDNTAGNLLLEHLGGPDGLEAQLEELGDDVTEVDRWEPELNTAEPGDLRDTSTPRALADDLRQYVLGDALEPADREVLVEWLQGNQVGDALIRAGVPDGWTVGDKTGAAAYGTRNDLGVLWPPQGDPIVLAILSHRNDTDAGSEAPHHDALIADAARAVVDLLG